MSTFTFKRGKLGGRLERVGRPYAQVDIKLDGKSVGLIAPPTWQTQDRKWSLRFQVVSTPSEANPAPWRAPRRSLALGPAIRGKSGWRRGEHKAVTEECPRGKRTRVGWILFGPNKFKSKTS